MGVKAIVIIHTNAPGFSGLVRTDGVTFGRYDWVVKELDVDKNVLSTSTSEGSFDSVRDAIVDCYRFLRSMGITPGPTENVP